MLYETKENNRDLKLNNIIVNLFNNYIDFKCVDLNNNNKFTCIKK